jgi:hypothetical protein
VGNTSGPENKRAAKVVREDIIMKRRSIIGAAVLLAGFAMLPSM